MHITSETYYYSLKRFPRANDNRIGNPEKKIQYRSLHKAYMVSFSMNVT